MKKLLILTLTTLSMSLLYSCDESITTSSSSSSSTSSSSNSGEIEYISGENIYLADLGEYNIPDDDTWIILDASAETTDFEGFKDALVALADSGREISVEFPALESFPPYAIFGEETSYSEYDTSALVSLSADVATTVENSAFRICLSLASINLPMATSIGESAFLYSAITSLDLPLVTTIGDSAFSCCLNLSEVYIPLVERIGYQAFAL